MSSRALAEAVGKGGPEAALTVVRRILAPAVENLEKKYLPSGDKKAISAGLNMIASALALTMDQLGETESAEHIRAAGRKVRAAK